MATACDLHLVQTKRFPRHPQLRRVRRPKIPLSVHIRRYVGRRCHRAAGKEAGGINVSRRTRRRAGGLAHPTARFTFGVQATVNLSSPRSDASSAEVTRPRPHVLVLSGTTPSPTPPARQNYADATNPVTKTSGQFSLGCRDDKLPPGW